MPSGLAKAGLRHREARLASIAKLIYLALVTSCNGDRPAPPPHGINSRITCSRWGTATALVKGAVAGVVGVNRYQDVVNAALS
jgi:hypothetical protein